MYMSVIQIGLSIKRWAEWRGEDLMFGAMEVITALNLNIHHMQVDNALNFSLPVIFAPTKLNLGIRQYQQ